MLKLLILLRYNLQNADCEDIEEGYRCKCKSGFRDVSPDPSKRAGRICKREENECADSRKNTCDRNADCIDELQGTTQCRAKILKEQGDENTEK